VRACVCACVCVQRKPVRITATFFDDFINSRLHKEHADEEGLQNTLSELKKTLLKRLEENGIFYEYQLRSVATQGTLNDVLECAQVSDAICEKFEKEANTPSTKSGKCGRTWHTFRLFLLSLSGHYDAMETTCANCGITAALLLTMTFANFGSITIDDWNSYLMLMLSGPRCQRHAEHLDDNLLSQNHRGWRPVYCAGVLQEVLQNVNTDLRNASSAGCIPVIDCAKWISSAAEKPPGFQ